VVEVRGLGLLLAAQLAAGIDARAVAAEALEAGLILNAVSPSALRLAPPLVVTDDDIDAAVALLTELIGAHRGETVS
jgi:acetylornithine/N-succinyldiaminopimelate aminotransferase